MRKPLKKIIASASIAVMLCASVPYSGNLAEIFSNKSSALEYYYDHQVYNSGNIYYDICEDEDSSEKYATILTAEVGSDGAVEIPETIDGYKVKSIHEDAFSECKALKKIVLPEGLEEIEDDAFTNCTALMDVYIPDSVTEFGSFPFSNVPNVTCSESTAENAEEFGARAVNGYVEGPLVYADSTKTKLCACSSDATGEITVPDSVTEIGTMAFYYCDGITGVTLLDTVTEIGECAFFRCEALKEVNIPDNITVIPYGAFSACFRLKGITIPGSVRTIEDYAFCNCGSIKNLVIPDTVESVEKCSFWNVTNVICSNEDLITELTTGDYEDINYFAPKNINGYNDGMFFYEDESKTVVTGCMADGVITIPETVKEIKGYAFALCNNITEATVPDTVETIGEETFSGCYDLKKVTVSEGISTIPYGMCNTCKGLEEVILPDSIRLIESCAFIGCSSLESIDLPNVDMEIDSYAFSGSGLKSIVIPENLTKVCGCFCGCHDLEEVTLKSDLTKDEYYPFAGCYNISDVILLGNGNGEFEDSHAVKNIYCDNDNFNCEKLYSAYRFKVNCSDDNFAEYYADYNDSLVKYQWGLGSLYEFTLSKAELYSLDFEKTRETELNKDVVLHGKSGSTLEKFAEENGLEFEEWEYNPVTLLTGANGSVSIEFDRKTFGNADNIRLVSEILTEDEADEIAGKMRLKGTQNEPVYRIYPVSNGEVIQPDGNVLVRIKITGNYDDTSKIMVSHFYDDGNGIKEETIENVTVIDGYAEFYVNHFSYFYLYENQELKIETPSVTSLNKGDRIVLRTIVPEGFTVKWTADNDNFTIEDNSDGTCTATADKNGNAVITAKLVNNDGSETEISDSVELTSNAGFWQKILCFFKNLFGLYTIYDK